MSAQPDNILDHLDSLLGDLAQPAPEPDHDAIERERQREQERRIAAARVRVANLASSMVAGGTPRSVVAHSMAVTAQKLLQDAERRGEIG